MKLWVLTKKKLLVLCGVLLAVCGIGVMVASCSWKETAPETAPVAVAPERKVPIYAVQTDEKKIAISFDAAWGNEQTPELLRILEKYHVKTTFFVVGDWVEKYPESVKAIHDAGHEVCNHSDTHPHMPQASRETQLAQLQQCNEKIQKITGQRPQLFRPPYGDYDNSVLDAVQSLSMMTVQWDVDSLDWKDLSAEEITRRVVGQVKNGSIVLFHNGGLHTPEALPGILSALQAEGYEIVPVSQLIYHDGFTIDPNTGLQKKAVE